MTFLARTLPSHGRILAIGLGLLVLAYIAWKVGQSPVQALQFTFNGLAVGAVYALLAMGFTFAYSTVWFFDLYYGAAATIGAYGVFYLQSSDALHSRYDVNNVVINFALAAVVAGVSAWALHLVLSPRLEPHLKPAAVRLVIVLLATASGAYATLVLSFPTDLNIWLSPLLGAAAAVAAGRAAWWGIGKVAPQTVARAVPVGVFLGAAAGVGCVMYFAKTPAANLYLSWVVSCLLAATVGLALYRGLYVYIRERAKSPLIMLVASLGVLLAVTAFISIAFESSPRPLPATFGGDSWTLGGAFIKGFNVFAIVVALLGFAGMWLLLKKTAFGRAVRAIGDDEQVATVVGINTTVIIALVFFIAAAYAALAGLISGHDTAIQPKMGLLLLLKGWIASVVGGIGNIYGAIVGGFALGLVEQFGIWDLNGEWRDAISFGLLIMFLSFWPNGLLPRR